MSNFAKRIMTKTDIGKSRTHRAAIRLPERDALRVFPQHLGKDRPKALQSRPTVLRGCWGEL